MRGRIRFSWRTALALAVAGLAVSPAGFAGTRSAPEVVDTYGDTADAFTGAPVEETDLDLVAAWFTETSAQFQVHVAAADLTVNTPSAYRIGVTSHLWVVSWNAGSDAFTARAGRDILGGTFGALSPGGANTDDGVATIAFDIAADEITITFPRAFADALTGQQWEFGSGTTFTAPRADSFEGLAPGSDRHGCAPCRQLDAAAPGRDFTFSSTIRNLYSGTNPEGATIDTNYVKLLGVAIHDQRGTGSFATYEFEVRTEHKSITFNDVNTDLHIGDVVLIRDFSGSYVISAQNTKFSGNATAVEITRA
ncbi:MAG: hypothetical protein HY556_11930 [Euryarchaeota archaeon]|nr:hypothetical protein [Euryarchaeota archaeon]